MTTKRAAIILIIFRVLLIAAALWTLNSAIEIAKASTGGDCDGDGRITMGDAVWLINYIFAGGPEPKPCECPRSFFLFDGEFPQVVETYTEDTNWTSQQFGGIEVARGRGIRKVYAITSRDSIRGIYWIVSESAREAITDQMMMMNTSVIDFNQIDGWSPDSTLAPVDTAKLKSLDPKKGDE